MSLGTNEIGGMMNKLNKLADSLYGTDEEIMNLSREEALELCGKDESWIMEQKEKLRQALKNLSKPLKVKQIKDIIRPR